jgi:hypothetical protein
MFLLLLGAYPLIYFAQEFVPIKAAIIGSTALVLVIIAMRAVTVMGLRLAMLGAPPDSSMDRVLFSRTHRKHR